MNRRGRSREVESGERSSMKLRPEGVTEWRAPRRPGPPLVSIVLPTYNRAALLPQSVDSILGQTERDLELLIVDDGSGDETREYAARMREQDPRVGYMREQNLGLPRALNNGFRAARGEFWTWTSDDNRYFPEAIERLSGYLRGHPEAGLVYGDMIQRREQGLVFNPPAYRDTFWRNSLFGAAFLYRAAAARQAGEYDASLRMVEDYDFMLRLSYVAEVGHWPYIIYEYGEHEESLTSTRPMEHLRAIGRMFEKHRRLGLASRRDLSDLAIQISGTSRRRSQCWNGIRFGIKAICLWPFNWRAYRSTLFAFVVGARRGWGSAQAPGAGRVPDKSSS